MENNSQWVAKAWVMKDCEFILTEAIRKMTQDDALNFLTDVGLFTDDKELFDLTEKLRRVLANQGATPMRTSEEVPCKPKRKTRKVVQEQEESNGMDEDAGTIEAVSQDLDPNGYGPPLSPLHDILDTK